MSEISELKKKMDNIEEMLTLILEKMDIKVTHVKNGGDNTRTSLQNSRDRKHALIRNGAMSFDTKSH